MIVYGASASPFVRKVLVAAAENGIAVDVRPFKPTERPSDFLEASPFGKIPEDRYLAGSRLTLADIAGGSMFASLQLIETSVDPARHPRLADYVDAILGRPSFANLMAEERKMFAADPA